MSVLETAKDFLCGCVSGWAQVFVMQPFELIKVRLINQSLASPQYDGIYSCFRKVLQEQGFFAFYKGSLTPFLGVGAQVALQFGSNQMVKKFLMKFNQEEDEMPTIELIFIAGLLTGIPSSIAATPIDHTRILLQLQKKTGKYNGSVDAGIKIYKQHGIKGLYLGFYPTLLREVIAMAVYFSTFEIGMKMFVQEGEPSSNAPILAAFLVGGLSGNISWLLTYPIDYVKTLIQSENLDQRKFSSAIDCTKKQYKAQGYKTFFKGLGVTMLRSFPVNGVGFLAFESMMRLTGRKKTLEEEQAQELEML